MHHRFAIVAAGIVGATGVAAGAFGAHALRAFLAERGTAEVWQTAVHYHLLHAAALLGAAGWLRVESDPRSCRRAVWAVRCWVSGSGLFSGSLYWLAVGAPRWVGPVTPLGGAALIAGWLFLAAAGGGPRRSS